MAQKYPELGKPNMKLIEMLIGCRAAGDKIILWTCREGQLLDDAVEYCRKYGDTTAGEMENKDVRNVMKHLFEYENTGLTPEQIADLKERDTAKPPIDIEDNYGFFVCPSCGNSIYASDDFESHKFCLNCGQRIKWEK